MREIEFTQLQEVSGGDAEHQCDDHDHDHGENEHEPENKNRTFDFSDWF